MSEFEMEKSAKLLIMQFPSSIDNIDKAVQNTSDFVHAYNKTIDPYELKLVLCEGITNAIVHGNKENETQNVHIKIILNENKIILEVTDEGRGFNWKQLLESQPLEDTNNVFAESGRGLALMKAYGYMVSFNETGNVLLVEKELAIAD